MPYEEAFYYARERTARFEGGFADDPADAGGATRWGASTAYARRHGYTGRMEKLPRALVDRWFWEDFWAAHELGAVSDREVAARVFDIAVNHSPRGAAGIVQRAVRAIWPDRWGEPIAADGAYGPATRAAVRRLAARYPVALTGALNGERWRYYLAIIAARPDQARFVRGWAERCA